MELDMKDVTNIFVRVKNKEKDIEKIISKFKLADYFDNDIYILDKPLILDTKYSYQDNSLIILIPNYKIVFINLGEDDKGFNNYLDEIIEDIGKISWRHNFEEIIGRSKQWKDKAIIQFNSLDEFLNEKLDSLKIEDNINRRLVNILISFFIGSINEAKRIQSLELPEAIIEKIKRRIILLDTDQVRFIFEEPKDKKRIVIQGLSGTGKTELLFHKLKELYLNPKDYKLLLTCHNKILATELRNRVGEFFNLMKVPKQIDSEYLKIFHAWGSKYDPDSGTYSYITNFYGIQFFRFGYYNFDKACQNAIEEIKKIKEQKEEEFEYAFDYVLIDESQDFPESFFELCELVTKEKVYIAGDIFQDIFDYNKKNTIEPDIILSKCYRTDNKNLMFSHALSMGLFETPHLRWFKEDNDWKKLGYEIKHEKGNVKLYRKPLNRFPDLEDNSKITDSIFVFPQANLLKKSIEIIENLNEQFAIGPEDIAIILIDNDNSIYNLITQLSYSISLKFQWNCNVAIESKKREKDSIFITNRNNVKGLEFPFVICLTKNLSKELSYRNTLYSMLSRSFIRSYLLVEENISQEILGGLRLIKEGGYIQAYEPDDEEIRMIEENIIKYNTERKTFEELLEEVFKEEKILDNNKKSEIKEVISKLTPNFDKEKLRKLVKSILNYKE